MEKIQLLEYWQKSTPENSSILQELQSGRAYTLIELSNSTQIKREILNGRLKEMVDNQLLQQRFNRQRCYYFIADKTLLARLNTQFTFQGNKSQILPKGMKYCRHCYRHLAGYVGVKIAEKLIEDEYFILHPTHFEITPSGWNWLSQFEIFAEDFPMNKRNTKNCLDFSERKPHLGGRLGDALLQGMKTLGWLAQVPNSREIKLTPKGAKALKQQLHLDFQYES